MPWRDFEASSFAAREVSADASGGDEEEADVPFGLHFLSHGFCEAFQGKFAS
jgi:hypothetical protein